MGQPAVVGVRERTAFLPGRGIALSGDLADFAGRVGRLGRGEGGVHPLPGRGVAGARDVQVIDGTCNESKVFHIGCMVTCASYGWLWRERWFMICANKQYDFFPYTL